MPTPPPIPTPDDFNPASQLPWRQCEATRLADRLIDLTRQVAGALPRGEHRLKDNLTRASSQLLKHLGLASTEPKGKLFHALIEKALRSFTEASLWVWQCIKHGLGPKDVAKSAWNVLQRIVKSIRALQLPGMAPYRDEIAFSRLPKNETTTREGLAEVEFHDDPPVDTARSPTSPPTSRSHSSNHWFPASLALSGSPSRLGALAFSERSAATSSSPVRGTNWFV